MYQSKGDNDAAIRHHKTAIELYPEYVQYRIGLARLYLSMGNVNGFIGEIVQMNGDAPYLYPALYTEMANKVSCKTSYDSMRAIVSEGIRRMPEEIEFRLAYILLELNAGNSSSALDEYRFIEKNDRAAAQVVREAIARHPCGLVLGI